MEKLKIITLCSGYDSQCMALDLLKEQYPPFDYELVAWSEIDKYAIQAHNAVYPQWADRNLGDMTKIDWTQVNGCDLLTYSTPCQDISQAGRQRGLEQGSDTRSAILWHTERAIRELRPKYLLMENVAALVSKKFIKYFQEWQELVNSYGYTSYSQVLNAKDYGIPQNRERIFMVSVRNDLNQRYEFPQPFPLNLRLRDMLEDEVDVNYLFSDAVIESFLSNNKVGGGKK